METLNWYLLKNTDKKSKITWCNVKVKYFTVQTKWINLEGNN